MAKELVAIVWTKEPVDLPFVCSRSLPLGMVHAVAAIVAVCGEHPSIASVIELEQ